MFIIFLILIFGSDILEKDRTTIEKGEDEMDDQGASANLFLGFKKILCRACLLLYYFFREKEKNDF